MRRFIIVLLLFVAVRITLAQTTSSVTFRVNMGPAAARGKINVAVGNVYLSGTMNGWNASSIPMTRTSSTTDTVYSVTLTDMAVDSVYEYKFLAGSSWELLGGDDNIHRKYKVKVNAADNILPVVYYSDDPTYPSFTAKSIQVSFKCNMELDISKGAFDPSVDKVSVRAGFNGWAEGASTMKKPLSGTIFSFDTTITMIPGDNFEYVYTYKHNNNTTWESANTKLELTEQEYIDGKNIELRYFNKGDEISTVTGYTLYFQTDVRNAVADIGGVKTPFPNGVKRIAVMGTEYPLVWPAIGWPDADTTRLLWMNDDGTKGDLVAHDSIWTLQIDYPKGALLKIAYKYGINYGMPGDNAGSNDNEIFTSGDANHWIYIGKEATVVRTHDVWGVIDTVTTTDVENTSDNVVTKYNLEQNYPNPFNPSTTIKYSVPKASMVTLKVYNMLGQEVAVLVNEVKSSSENFIAFNASNLPSGLYIYQLTANNYSASKKMLLLK
jgi:hypothetical protein